MFSRSGKEKRYKISPFNTTKGKELYRKNLEEVTGKQMK
jgi:hypothetical protein